MWLVAARVVVLRRNLGGADRGFLNVGTAVPRRGDDQSAAWPHVELRRGDGRIFRHHAVPHPDPVLRHVDDHHVRRAEAERAFPVFAHLRVKLRFGIGVVHDVRAHRQARLDLVVQVAGGVGRVVPHVHEIAPHHRQDAQCPGRGRDDLGLDLGNQQINALGVFRGQRVRSPIAGEGQAHAVPIQAICRRTVLTVRLAPVADHHAVFLVSDAAIVLVVELMDVHVPTLADRQNVKAVPVPGQHLFHALQHVARAERRPVARRAGDPQRFVPPPGPPAERIDVGQRPHVIPVQVGQENVLDAIERHARGDVVRSRPWADIEDEVLAVAEFDIDRRAHLPGPDQRRSPHEGHPHFVGLNLLGPGKPVDGALHPGHRLEPGEGQALNPAAERLAPGRQRRQHRRIGLEHARHTGRRATIDALCMDLVARHRHDDPVPHGIK